MPSKKVDDNDESKRRTDYGLSLNYSSFLGGLTFAAMVFVMQAKENFIFLNFNYYPDILITSLAGISFLFIVPTSILADAISRVNYTGEGESELAKDLTRVAWFSIIVIIPFLVLPFTWIGAIFIGIFEIVIITLLVLWQD